MHLRVFSSCRHCDVAAVRRLLPCCHNYCNAFTKNHGHRIRVQGRSRVINFRRLQALQRLQSCTGVWTAEGLTQDSPAYKILKSASMLSQPSNLVRIQLPQHTMCSSNICWHWSPGAFSAPGQCTRSRMPDRKHTHGAALERLLATGAVCQVVSTSSSYITPISALLSFASQSYFFFGATW